MGKWGGFGTQLFMEIDKFKAPAIVRIVGALCFGKLI